jgi:3-oxoacyl-[acyl-carrier protein] reductase
VDGRGGPQPFLNKDLACSVAPRGARTSVCALDLRDPGAAEALVKTTLDRFGRIDALLNIAGAVPQIDLLEMTDSQWEDGLAPKFQGARRLTNSSLGRSQSF